MGLEHGYVTYRESRESLFEMSSPLFPRCLFLSKVQRCSAVMTHLFGCSAVRPPVNNELRTVSYLWSPFPSRSYHIDADVPHSRGVFEQRWYSVAFPTADRIRVAYQRQLC